MNDSTKKTKTPTLKNLSLIKKEYDPWKKIQFLIDQEIIKENLIAIQEEMESSFLTAINFNWTRMDSTEKKLAIKLGCLIQNLKENLKEAFEKN